RKYCERANGLKGGRPGLAFLEFSCILSSTSFEDPSPENRGTAGQDPHGRLSGAGCFVHATMKFIIGTKQYMTQLFDEGGIAHAATVIAVGPMAVTQVKTVEKD